MYILLWSIALLVISLSLHFLWWKIRLPKRQLSSLLKLFTIILFLWININLLLSHYDIAFLALPLPSVHILHVSLTYYAASLGYIVLFTTIEADSPSLLILRIIDAAGKNGLTLDELYMKLCIDRFMASRIDRLVADNMATRTSQGIIANSKGSLLLSLVIFWRTVMGASDDLG